MSWLSRMRCGASRSRHDAAADAQIDVSKTSMHGTRTPTRRKRGLTSPRQNAGPVPEAEPAPIVIRRLRSNWGCAQHAKARSYHIPHRLQYGTGIPHIFRSYSRSVKAGAGPWRRRRLQREQAGRMSDPGGSVRAGRFAPCDRRVLTRGSRRRSLGASLTPAPGVPALRRDGPNQKWSKRPRPQTSKSGSNDPVPKHPPSSSGRTSERPARSDGSTGRTAPPGTRRSPPRA